MLGAIIGDIIGSTHEYDNRIKTKDFELFPEGSTFTDDTVLTVAVADSLLNNIPYSESFYKWVSKYPNRGYGQQFFQWVISKDKKPYGSKGNGAAMRVSPIAWYFDTEKEVLEEAKRSAEITHNSKEGIESVQAVAIAIFMARKGKSKEKIKKYIMDNFGYDLDRKLDDVRDTYVHSMRAKDSVPESIICFLESDTYEDALRNAVSLGGDADTMACIGGSIAEAYYGSIPEKITNNAIEILPVEFKEILYSLSQSIVPADF
jgi:ADP-ribosylglycohydrolase